MWVIQSVLVKLLDLDFFVNFYFKFHSINRILGVCNENLIFLFLNQTYVVGTQKNRLNETVLFSTQNIC